MSEDSIAFHVFGLGRFGECSLIERPGRWWGCVDFYSRGGRSVDIGPVIRYLRKRAVRELRFLCVTHPHFDHFHGLASLIAELTTGEPNDPALWQFWRTFQDHIPVVRALGRETARLGESADLCEEEAQAIRDLPGELIDLLESFKATMKWRQRRRRAGTAVGRERLPFYRWVGDGAPAYPFDPWPAEVPRDPDPPVSIRVLEPTTEAWSQYLERIHDAAGEGRVPNPRHNEISAAIQVTFGVTRAALLGDGECSTWSDSRGGRRAEELRDSHFVKIPHHGAVSSHDSGLWDILAGGDGPRFAVTTTRRRHGLPDAEVLKAIHAHGFEVISTSPSDGGGRDGWGRVSLWFDAEGALQCSELEGDAVVCHGRLP